jgi:anti-sigma regulatory factor (Ser/Thr protein kinase)
MRDQSSDTGSEVVAGTKDRRGTPGREATAAPETTPLTPTTTDTGIEEGGYDDGQSVTLALRSEPASVRIARRFVDRWLGSAADSQFGEDIQLVASELVTNAVRHSSLAGLRLSRDGDCVILEVDDHSQGEPRIAEELSPAAASGRGLVIVDRLVSRWGWRPLPDGGKRVWCEVCTTGG